MQRLVIESDGRVVGVIARRYGTELAVRARRGVVLASGQLRLQRVDGGAVRAADRRPAGRLASKQHDGVAIRMAQALGADLAHMDATEVAFLVDPQLVVRGILVNGRGQRYVAEDTYPGRIGQLTLYQQDDTAFLVLDADAHEQAMAARSATPFLLRPPTWVCESVADLETEIGLPTGSLQTTVAAYNEAAARGDDPLLHKKPEWLRPIGTPVGRHRSARKHRRFYPWRPAHVAVRRGATRQRRTDSRPFRGRTSHRRTRRVGVCQRRLAGRRQLLRPPGRADRRHRLTHATSGARAAVAPHSLHGCDRRHSMV